MRVVQIEPGPMPTLMPSTPAFTRSRAASAVATLPPMTCRSPHFALMRAIMSSTPLRMAMRGIDHHHVDAGLAQRRDALERVLRRADRRADAQAARRILAGAREFRGLLEILHGDHAAQFFVAVDHQHLLDAVLVQQQQHFFLRRVLAHGDQPFLRRHDRRHRRVELHLEAQVAMRDDADDLGALHHRHAGNAFGSGQLDDLADGHVGRDGDRIADHAALEFLDARDFARPGRRWSWSCG